MVAARGRQAAVAWFTVKADQGQAYAAFSGDAGRSWDAPLRLDDGGSLGRVDVELLDDESAVASWVEFADRRAQFRIRRVDRAGGRSAAVTVAGIEGSTTSGFPRIGRHGRDLVFAWTESQAGAGGSDPVFQVRTATAHLPQ
jgi:hypothetical protein